MSAAGFSGRAGLACLTLLLALPLSAGHAQEPGRSVTRPRTAAEDLQMFSQVLNQIRVNHPDSVDLHKLYMAAIEGMVRAVDPHSYVLPAMRLSPEKEKAYREGKLVPVPIDFAFVRGAAVVVSVNQSSAAAALDILPGDELVAIAGEPLATRGEEELAITLAGARNTTVSLTFERQRLDGSTGRFERAVRRERAEEASAVPTAFMMDARTGYIRITTFANDKAAEDLRAALVRLERAGMSRLLLDLRDNGGGSVREATTIAGEFLPKGAVVYSSEGRKEEVRQTARVQRSFWRSEKRYPIVVLVNGGTASASELVAGALQDHDRALVVGRPTFGKSLLMQGFPLSDGSVMVLVIGQVKTPCGRTVQREYREVTARSYYRLAEAERDTVGRPSCRTAGGRVVYGGGGIYPDVVLPPREPRPLWLSRIQEENLMVKWIGGYLAEPGSLPATPEGLASQPMLPESAIAAFREFARRHGVDPPEGPEADSALQRALVLRAAATRWGAAGYYRVAAALDPEVSAAAEAFQHAERVLAHDG